MKRLASTTLLTLALLVVAGGCANKRASRTADLNQWLVQQETLSISASYRVQPPDKLAIVAPKIKELDGQIQVVRPDGRISLNLLGELEVAGKTPDEISSDLRALASKFYTPDVLDISVRVEEFASQFVYVFGQVEQPGIKPYTGRDTLVTILAQSQLSNEAWPQRIVIVRPNEDVEVRQKVTVDLREMYSTGAMDQNFLIEPGDVIYVPPSPLAQLNTTFDKLLFPIRPMISLATLATGGI